MLMLKSERIVSRNQDYKYEEIFDYIMSFPTNIA
jgi:hypothetical protein